LVPSKVKYINTTELFSQTLPQPVHAVPVNK
jgi:hypothetical protein